MAIYTGVADANGDFKVPFSTSYTSGQKIVVTAEKDSATKSIELFAPSDAIGGGAISWTGSNSNFPRNIGDVTLSSAINEVIAQYAFYVENSSKMSFGYNATKLTIKAATEIGAYAFYGWANAVSLILPNTLQIIGAFAFRGWVNAASLNIPEGVIEIRSDAFQSWDIAKTLTLPSTVTYMGSYAFSYWSSATEVIVNATTPPEITSNTFDSLNSACVFKVPAASVVAYKAAPNWSAFASRIQAI